MGPIASGDESTVGHFDDPVPASRKGVSTVDYDAVAAATIREDSTTSNLGESAADITEDSLTERDIDSEGGSQTSTCRSNSEKSSFASSELSLSFAGLARGAASAGELTDAGVIKPALLGPRQSSAIVVNYISAGYILLPFAFYEAGILYSALILVLVALQSYITSVFILETCARAECLKRASREGPLPGRCPMTIRDTQYELSGLARAFLGPKLAKLFTVTTACDLYGITWLLTAVFGKALANQVPVSGIDDDYQFWIGVFILVTIPLSCTHILDQVLIQFIFLAGRMLMVVLMLGTLIVAFFNPGGDHFGEGNERVSGVPLANPKNTMAIIQTAIFATAFQFSVPAMAGISKNKKSMNSIFQHAVIFVYVSNTLLAIMTVLFFGSSTDPSNNLNWSNYHSGSTAWSKFISGFIVLFAALDGLAVFPLLCSTLGGILHDAVAGPKDGQNEPNWKAIVVSRLAASLPQSIGALYIDDLGLLARYGSIFTLLSYSVAPALLYLASGWKMAGEGLTKNTFYSSSFISSEYAAYTVIALSFIVVVGVLLDAFL